MESRNIPITAVDQFDFLEHRKEQEKLHWNSVQGKSPLDSILTVEINTTELCNRTCVFCPRHDPKVFPNRNLHLTLKGAEIISEELGENQFNGKISWHLRCDDQLLELSDKCVQTYVSTPAM